MNAKGCELDQGGGTWKIHRYSLPTVGDLYVDRIRTGDVFGFAPGGFL